MRYILHHRPNVTSCPPICCRETTDLRRPIPIVYKASVKLVPHSQLLEQLTTTVVQCFKVSTWSHQLQCDNQAVSFEVLDQSVHLDPLMSHYRKSRRWELEQRETGMQKQFSSSWAKQQLTISLWSGVKRVWGGQRDSSKPFLCLDQSCYKCAPKAGIFCGDQAKFPCSSPQVHKSCGF